VSLKGEEALHDGETAARSHKPCWLRLRSKWSAYDGLERVVKHVGITYHPKPRLNVVDGVSGICTPGGDPKGEGKSVPEVYANGAVSELGYGRFYTGADDDVSQGGRMDQDRR
jgi:hypothetical protein